MYIQGGYLAQAMSTNFTSNTAGHFGGAVFCNQTLGLSLGGQDLGLEQDDRLAEYIVKVENNTACGGGGLASISSGIIDLRGLRFSRNSGFLGGSLYVKSWNEGHSFLFINDTDLAPAKVMQNGRECTS